MIDVDICEKINLSRHMLEAENNNTLQASHSFEFVFSLRVISSAFTDLSGWHVLLKDEDFKTYVPPPSYLAIYTIYYVLLFYYTL